MNKLYLLSSKLGWLALLLVALAGCALSSTPEATTAPPATQTPGVTQIPPPATYTPSLTLQAQAVAPSPTSAPPTPTLTPTPLIPPCAFEARSAAEAVESSLDTYTFSEPQEMLISSTEIVEIVGWLPDSQRLLVTYASRDVSETRRQTIETLDVYTGESQVLAERNDNGTRPVWLPAQQAVAYLDREYVDASTGIVRFDLWVSRGNPAQAQLVAENVSWRSLGVDAQNRLTFFSETAMGLQVVDMETGDRHSWSPESFYWTYSSETGWSEPTLAQYNVAWQPGGSLLLLYTRWGTFLLDIAINQVCAIDLGAYVESGPIRAVGAEWSPDGRYLAMVTTSIVDPQQLLDFSKVTILDTEVGGLYTFQPAPDISPGQGQRFVGGIAWAPDSHHLVMWGYVSVKQVGLEGQGLYLIDVANTRYQRLFPEIEFQGGTVLFWSPDGSQLLMSCPTSGLCLSLVEAKR